MGEKLMVLGKIRSGAWFGTTPRSLTVPLSLAASPLPGGVILWQRACDNAQQQVLIAAATCLPHMKAFEPSLMGLWNAIALSFETTSAKLR
jgi:hypothetical protein